MYTLNSILQYSPFITLCLGSIIMNHVISELCYKGTILQMKYRSGSEITPCNKIDKPLVVYRFSGNVITSITLLRT